MGDGWSSRAILAFVMVQAKVASVMVLVPHHSHYFGKYSGLTLHVRTTFLNNDSERHFSIFK